MPVERERVERHGRFGVPEHRGPDHRAERRRDVLGLRAGHCLSSDDVDVEEPGDDVGVLDGGAEAVDAPGEMAQHVRTRMRRTY
ncbi:hypothetical protein GCM10009769_24290 [Curtobacterium luteum]|uniref:Uncharacterized protein n=1 Tax=Curtobacterium luteum TaxID=33881 RepID=A0A8H9GC72_9MICO|nr:hypothetical protein GCM10009769_24290 [Curtobacterium luteum]